MPTRNEVIERSVGNIIEDTLARLSKIKDEPYEAALAQVYTQAKELQDMFWANKISRDRLDEALFQLASDSRHIFLEIVRKTGHKEVAARLTGIPLQYWEQLAATDYTFEVQLKYALEEGELNFQREAMKGIGVRNIGQVQRAIVNYLKMRHPERFNVRISKSVTKEEVAKEIIHDIERILQRALNKEGVEFSVQEKIIFAFRDEIRRTLLQRYTKR